MSTASTIINALQQRDLALTQESPYRYRCHSPLRLSSDSHAFVLTVQPDGEHGCWYDHVAGVGGSLYELAELLHIPLPNRANGPMTAEEYAHAHGVSWAVFQSAGWRVQTVHGRKGLIIPTDTGQRVRFLDGQKPKFWHAKAYRPCWYRLRDAVTISHDRRRNAIILCNGEPSVVVAQHCGLPATCITSSGERAIPEALLAELLDTWTGPVIVAMDNDDKGREASRTVARQLLAAGYQHVGIADLNGHVGYDLADWCADHRDDAWPHLLTRVRRVSLADLDDPTEGGDDDNSPPSSDGNGDLLTVAWGSEMDAIPEPVDLVAGWLTRGTVALLVGAPEVGKSTVAVDLACRVAQHYRVLYVACEAPANVKVQIDAWRQHHGLPVDRLGLVADGVTITDNLSLDKLRATIVRHQVALVVIDTLSASLAGLDENSPEIAGVLGNLNTLARETDCTILLLHHPLKSDARVYRGHSSLLANTHTTLLAEREPGDTRLRLSVLRHRGVRAPDAWFELTPIDLGVNRYGRPMRLPVIVPVVYRRDDRLTDVHYAILDYLADIGEDGATVGEITEAVLQDVRCSAPTVRRAIALLVRTGYIAADGRRGPRVISAKGRELVKTREAQRAAEYCPSPFEVVSASGELAPSPQPDTTPPSDIDALPPLPAQWRYEYRDDGVVIVAPGGRRSAPIAYGPSQAMRDAVAKAYGKLLYRASVAD